jgi:hypothetical protein
MRDNNGDGLTAIRVRRQQICVNRWKRLRKNSIDKKLKMGFFFYRLILTTYNAIVCLRKTRRVTQTRQVAATGIPINLHCLYNNNNLHVHYNIIWFCVVIFREIA